MDGHVEGRPEEAEHVGVVEAISETTAGRVAQRRFLFSGAAEMLEDLGFTRVRQVGKHAWILVVTVPPAD